MLYTIYKITNKINGKVYIGKHQTEEHNKNISKARTGKKHSPETIEKIKLARKKQVFSKQKK